MIWLKQLTWHNNMKLLNVKLISALLLTSVLVACSSTDEDEETAVAELTDIQAQFTPNVEWEVGIGNGVEDYFSRLRPTVAYGKLYSASREGLVIAVDANSGKRVWSRDLSDIEGKRGFFEASISARVAGGPIAGLGKVYYGTENGYMFALDANTGELLWKQSVKGEVISAPDIDSNVLVVNTAAGVISGLDANSGEVLWSAEQDVPPLTLRGSSGVATNSGGAIIGESSGEVSVYILENGQKGWTAEIGEPTGSTELERVVDVDTTPIIFGENVYAISSRGQLVSLDLRSGRIIWKRQYSSYSELTLEGNTIFATDVKGHVYAIDRVNGQERWSQLAFTNRGVTGPTVYKNYVVVGDFEGYLHWLDLDTGEIVSRNQVDSSGIHVAPTVNNGILYSQARNGDLQAITAR